MRVIQLMKEIGYIEKELDAIQIKIDKANNPQNDPLYMAKYIVDYFMMEYFRTASRKKQLEEELAILTTRDIVPDTDTIKEDNDGFYSSTNIIQDDIVFRPRKPKKEPAPKTTTKPSNKANDSYQSNDDNEVEVCPKKIRIENQHLLDSFDVGVLNLAIKKVPARVSQLFFDKGYKIAIVTNDKIGYHVAGKCSYTKKTIELACDVANSYDRTMYHELGHMIDYDYNGSFTSDSAQFLEIYKKEKKHLVYLQEDMYNYCTRDPQEYFAESFAEYIESSYELKRNAPKTYQFINDYVKTL